LRIYPETDVIMHTSKGDIRVAMRPDEAPNTAWNFLELGKGGFYRGVVFHRIVPLTANGQPFVIQAGDPTGTGDGGPGYWLPIEDSSLPHDFGVISMARSDDPDSNGSQIFFCLSREGTARLDGQYCSFGYAVDGADVIKSISEVELADVATGRPVQPPVITEAELVPAPARTPGSGRPDSRVTLEDAKQREQKPTGRVPR
jgi:peptidyl-prolyl cis-trans isomerase B (cyclophilin B)